MGEVPVLAARFGGRAAGKEAFEAKRADTLQDIAAAVFPSACELEFDHPVSFGQMGSAGHVSANATRRGAPPLPSAQRALQARPARAGIWFSSAATKPDARARGAASSAIVAPKRLGSRSSSGIPLIT